MPKQKLKPFDYAFVKMMQEKMGVKFVDSKGKPIEFEQVEQMTEHEIEAQTGDINQRGKGCQN